jgi:hypothetical protein
MGFREQNFDAGVSLPDAIHFCSKVESSVFLKVLGLEAIRWQTLKMLCRKDQREFAKPRSTIAEESKEKRGRGSSAAVRINPRSGARILFGVGNAIRRRPNQAR